FKMATHKDTQRDVSQNIVVKWLSHKFPITQHFVNDRFFVKINGVIHATPMVLVVATIESSDIMFAIDSVPAAFAITRNPWIILGANILAILGLRSIFFLLSHADQRFSYLRYGVAVILVFVGLKMIVKDIFHIPSLISLCVIILTLGGSVALSILKKNKTCN
ncbi:MAG: TerC family protein, partial [bacterium]